MNCHWQLEGCLSAFMIDWSIGGIDYCTGTYDDPSDYDDDDYVY